MTERRFARAECADMREIDFQTIADAARELCARSSYDLPADVERALAAARAREVSPTGAEILDSLLGNARVARDEKRPICQDTGFAVFFIEKGAEAVVSGGTLTDAVNEGVRRGYEEAFLRKSIVRDPLDRVNTKDNTPAVIHLEEVPGDRISIKFMAKGGGCENMSRLAMLTPADGREGVIRFVTGAVDAAGANPCPPIVVGVGLGGTFEVAALLAKKALLRELGSSNPDSALDALEKDILEKINNLGIGPQGMGGRVTALGVHVISHPCHIASLPVAVNIECHAHRSAEVVL